jgi:hypothetical protein
VEVDAVLLAIEWVAVALAWLSLPLLGVALAGQVRRRSAGDRSTAVSPLARLSQAVVVVLMAVGLTAAVATGVPLAFGWAALAAIALMAVLLRRDERFWAALAVLLPLFSLIGAVILVALSHNYASTGTEAAWYGGRQLIEWGGMEANPTHDGWWWTIVALAITRYGLPLALVLTTSWLVSVRRAMSRVERLGLVTAAESLLVSVLFGAAFSILVLGAGLLQGLPWWLVVAGVLGSIVTLVTVGPGAVNGVLVGGRTLASRVPTAAQGAATLVSSLGDARETGMAGADGLAEPEPDATWHSFLSFVRGDLSTAKRWNLTGLAVFGGLVGLGMLGTGVLQRVDDSRPVRFEYISDEVGVGFRAIRGVRAGGSDDVWLRGAGGEVAHFDLATGRLTPAGLAAWSLAADGDDVLALTRGDPTRVVRLDPDEPDDPVEVVSLDRPAHGRLAVGGGGSVYVAGDEGGLTRFDRESGSALATVRDQEPAVLVVLRGPVLWTVYEQDGDLTAPYRVERRDPRTLEPTSGPGGVDLAEVLAGRTNAGPQVEALVAGAVLGIADDDPPRFFPAADGTGTWRAEGLGELSRERPDGPELRFDVPFDSVLGVFEADDHTWLLAEDDQGTVLATDEVTESVLARWDAWPR